VSHMKAESNIDIVLWGKFLILAWVLQSMDLILALVILISIIWENII
jgi:hypothetical protein